MRAVVDVAAPPSPAERPMARYKYIDTSPRFLPVDLAQQVLPGTFEHAVHYLLTRELDLSAFDARFRNDETGAPASPPAMLLALALCASAYGLVRCRGMTNGGGELRRISNLGVGRSSRRRRSKPDRANTLKGDATAEAVQRPRRPVAPTPAVRRHPAAGSPVTSRRATLSRRPGADWRTRPSARSRASRCPRAGARTYSRAPRSPA
jgi:hypothetical protein